MKHRTMAFLVNLALTLFAAPLEAEAQPMGRVVMLGLLWPTCDRTDPPGMDIFRNGLRDLGYIEGRNVTLIQRCAATRELLPDRAAELVRLNVDMILTVTTTAARAARQASTSIPIIMIAGSEPVHAGLATSLARPGGNVTGFSVVVDWEIDGKRVELLKEAVPSSVRVALLHQSPISGRPFPEAYKVVVGAARVLGITLHPIVAKDADHVPEWLAALGRERFDAVIVDDNAVNFIRRRAIIAFTERSGLPAIYPYRDYVEVGGLMSYGPDLAHNYRRAATYVDRIVKGARPAELPIEQPTKFDLVINLKTAKALGLTIPQSILVRANEVIQ
jgi:putative ABC transport system substrate-binding protein